MKTRLFVLMAGCLCLAHCVSTAHAQWVQSLKSADVAYFLFSASPRLERYSLATSQWLAPVSLPTAYGAPTKFHVDADGLYVAYGQAVKRYTLTGGNEAHLLNTLTPVQEIFSDGNILLINRSSGLYARFTSVNKTNGAIIADFENYVDSVYGAAIAPSINKIFGRTQGISPADISFVQYNDDGTFADGGASPHHGDYPSANRVWVFPGDGRVVDDSGTVYSAGSLNFLNSFGSGINDLDFYGSDIPIVLRTNRLSAYSNALLPVGSRLLSFTPGRIYVAGTNVLTFTGDGGALNGIRVDVVPLATLNPPTPGQPVDPNGLSYTPDDAFLDRNGVLYLLSKSQQSLFRWDTRSQRYLVTIPLVEVPSFAAYSEAHHKIYVAYPAGLIRQIDLAGTNFVETPFANLPSSPIGLGVAGPYVFAVDPSGAWVTHYTFDSAGNLADSVDWNYYSREYIWSPVNQKMYFFRDDTSPNDVLSEAINADGTVHTSLPLGGIGGQLDSPLHGSEGFVHPIRVSPDGSLVVLGSGVLHDATTLARLPLSLGNSFTDAAWTPAGLRTLRTINNLAQFQQWNGSSYAQGLVRQVPGLAHRLFGFNTNQLLAVTLQNSTPAFYIMDGNFNILPPTTLQPPSNLRVTISSSLQVDLLWNDVAGEESYAIERRTGGSGAWVQIGTTTMGVVAFTDTSASVGNLYYYRVIARNNALASLPSAEVPASLVVPAVPGNFAALALDASSIRVTWNDVTGEGNYELERRIGSSGSWVPLITLSAGNTSFVNTGLNPNTEYFYRVKAVNAIGASAYSSIASATTPAIPPTTPSLFGAEAAGPFSVNLYWSDASYEENYVIERRTGTTGNWSVIAFLPPGITTYTDNTVSNFTLYAYRLYATNVAGASGYSQVRSVTTPQIPPPPAPTQLSAKPLSVSTVVITWNDVSFETGYRLERRTEGPASWAVVATVPANTTSYLDTNLVQGTLYFYRVQAFNNYGPSPYSNEDDATPANIVNVIEDDFDPQLDTGVWHAISGGTATNGGQGFRGSRALYFSGSGVRSAITIPVEIAPGSTLEFFLRAGNEAVDGALWNNSESGDNVIVEYSKDQGAGWTLIQTINTAYPNASAWGAFNIAIPPGAVSASTQFRWRQANHSGPAFDCWALDDVGVRGIAPTPPEAPPFIISSPSSSTSIAVLWIGVPGATHYTLERRRGFEAWATLRTLPGTVTYYTDTAVAPSGAYSYRVNAVNAGGQSPYSPVTTSVTWTQMEQWSYDNYGNPDAMIGMMTTPNPDGTLPLLRYAFNLNSDEPQRRLRPDETSGFPAIWLDVARNRLCIEFVRRKPSMNPGITYAVQFASDLSNWQSTSGILVETASIDSLWERVRYEDSVTAQPNSARFGRVVVAQE
jgi:hypothetical protein